MGTYRRPDEIPGYGRVREPWKSLRRELAWAAVLGAALGAVLLSLGRGPWTFAGSVALGLGIGFGGWLAEAVFYRRVAARLADPFGPGASLARATLWSAFGGTGVWLGQACVSLLSGGAFAGVAWLVGGAVLTVFLQAPLRMWHRRRDRRVLDRARS